MRIIVTSVNLTGIINKIIISPKSGNIRLDRFINTGKIDLKFQNYEFLTLICGIFILEGLLRDGSYDGCVIEKNSQTSVEIEIDYISQEQESLLRTYITYLLSFSLGLPLDIHIKALSSKWQTSIIDIINSKGAVCLFSGGADSFTGILSSKREGIETIGVFVSHAMLRKLVEEKLIPFMNSEGIPIKVIKIPKGRSKLQQMRGFVYAAIGTIVAHTEGMNKVIISEIGPVMFQPAYDILDEVTITTHPVTLELTRKILEVLYKETFEYITPFKSLTKAEAVSFVSDFELLKKTNSCRSTRYSNNDYPNCGRCLGCLIRRISFIVAGIEDGKDDKYAWDVFLKGEGEDVVGRGDGWKIKPKSFSDLYQIFNFADSILRNIENNVSSPKIDDFKLNNLFTRFSLDVVSAAYLMYDKKKLGRNPIVENFYQSLKRDGIINAEMLEERILSVRNREYKPDF